MLLQPPEKHLSRETDFHKCPFCAELILKEAIKCRYCGERVAFLRYSYPEPPRNLALWVGLIAIAGILLSLILYGLAAWGDSVGQAQREGKEPTATTATLPSNRKYVASANYGDDWPLSVGEGYVYSMELEPVGSMRRFAAIFEAGGIRYGMNGTALTAGYADINTIRTGEKIVGIVPEDTVYRYKDVGFLIEMALENKN